MYEIDAEIGAAIDAAMLELALWCLGLLVFCAVCALVYAWMERKRIEENWKRGLSKWRSPGDYY